MAKHTPGPWFADFKTEQVYSADNVIVYELGTHEADGHLIAAAPVLLAACKKARKFLQSIAYNTDEMDALDQAIAAAEGEA